MQSQVFFFISSVGFIILGILTAIVLVYILGAVSTVSRILKKAEKDIDFVGDITKRIVDDIRGSYVFQFLFKSKKGVRK